MITKRKKLPREDEFAEIFQEMLKIKMTEKYQDLRFGQIMEVVRPKAEDLYYMRDERLLEVLKELNKYE